MMKAKDRTMVKLYLLSHLEAWLDEVDTDEINRPWLSDETLTHMADAALGVFFGIADVQQNLMDNKMLVSE